MIVWIDAQISPAIAVWIRTDLGINATAIREIGLRDAEDLEIFESASEADAIVITKDRDFVLLLDRFGPPPKIIWLRCGNTSNSALRKIFSQTLAKAIELLDSGEVLVEISSPS